MPATKNAFAAAPFLPKVTNLLRLPFKTCIAPKKDAPHEGAWPTFRVNRHSKTEDRGTFSCKAGHAGAIHRSTQHWHLPQEPQARTHRLGNKIECQFGQTHRHWFSASILL